MLRALREVLGMAACAILCPAVATVHRLTPAKPNSPISIRIVNSINNLFVKQQGKKNPFKQKRLPITSPLFAL